MILKLIKREEGISLIEVLIALAILGVIAATFLTALSVSSKGVLISDERAVAESLARSQMESVREQLYETAFPLVNGEAEYNPPIDTSAHPSFAIYSVNRAGETVLGVIGVPWNSEDNQAEIMDRGLQRIKLVIKNHDKVVLELESYKVSRQ